MSDTGAEFKLSFRDHLSWPGTDFSMLSYNEEQKSHIRLAGEAREEEMERPNQLQADLPLQSL